MRLEISGSIQILGGKFGGAASVHASNIWTLDFWREVLRLGTSESSKDGDSQVRRAHAIAEANEENALFDAAFGLSDPSSTYLLVRHTVHHGLNSKAMT